MYGEGGSPTTPKFGLGKDYTLLAQIDTIDASVNTQDSWCHNKRKWSVGHVYPGSPCFWRQSIVFYRSPAEGHPNCTGGVPWAFDKASQWNIQGVKASQSFPTEGTECAEALECAVAVGQHQQEIKERHPYTKEVNYALTCLRFFNLYRENFEELLKCY
jgi:hypothetical protein